MKNELPVRKKNRLENYDYSSSGAYFLTICTKDRVNLFWHKCQPDPVGEDIILPPDEIQLSIYGRIAEHAVMEIPEHYAHIKLDHYVIMPNHIHMILSVLYDGGRIISSPTVNRKGNVSPPSVISAVGQMKRYVSRQIGRSIWQRSFHDHIIRNRDDYNKIARYIAENPVKWQYDCFYRE